MKVSSARVGRVPLLIASLASAALVACGQVGVSGGGSQTVGAQALGTGSASVGSAQAPTISGTPAAQAMAGAVYSFQPSTTDATGKGLSFTISNRPAWANFNASTGQLVGTPSAADVGTDPGIVIAVSNGKQSASLPAFTITVALDTPAAPPTISGTPGATAVVGVAYSFQPSASDAKSSTLTFAITGKPSWAVFDTSTGRLTGTPSAPDVGTSAAIVISVSDGTQVASLRAFTITVDPAAPPPPPSISGTPGTRAIVSRGYMFRPSASDATGARLKFSIAAKPTWASFNTTSGQLSGTPGSANVGTDTGIVISVSDGASTASLPAFSITVASAAVPPPPTISGTPATAVEVGQGYSFQPSAADAAGGTLSFSITGKPAWASFDSTTGQLSGTPGAASVGTYTGIVISVADGVESASLAPFSVAVTAAPTISGTAPGGTEIGEAYTFTPTAAARAGAILSFAILGKPAWASFDTATGQLSGTPTAADAGSYAGIVISVSDGIETASLAPFTIKVAAGPVLGGIPATNASVGALYSFTPSASDPAGNGLMFSISNQPAWAAFNIATGQLSGTPAAANLGTYSGIVISVTDGIASASLPAFAITVTGASSGPTISGTPGTTATAGTPWSFTPTTTDPSGNPLTFSVTSPPSWASFDPATGRLSGTPSASDVGSYAGIVISVSDGAGSAALPAFTLTVSAAAVNPTVTLTASPTSIASGGSALLSWSATNALSCSASGGWSGSEPTSGSASTGPLGTTTTFTLTCSGASGTSAATQSATVSVQASGGALGIVSPGTLPAATAGGSYFYPLQASGGTPPYVWSLSSGGGATSWYVTPGGWLEGAPRSNESDSLVVAVSDAAGHTVQGTFSVTVNSNLAVMGQDFGKGAIALPGASVGAGYRHTLQAAGGSAPYSWSIASGSLP
ncbi:MAG: putative Ig domain-containing protein, partial [Gammaproteobacteria bacterium]|nr:putative Ig domain-containing protein [Gammaproteobacteria bacterium]